MNEDSSRSWSGGLEFCRFADDCNIFVRTPKAAQRVMARIGGYIEKRLKLVVNQDKSQLARSDRVKFLGLTIVGDAIGDDREGLWGYRPLLLEDLRGSGPLHG